MEFLENEKAKAMLHDMTVHGRASHAVLLCGSRGTGKKLFARYLAAAYLCEKNPPCFSCTSCKKVLSGLHPDVREITQYTKPRSFPVDEVRRVRREAYISPNEGACRVFILANLESMGQEAQNALLKIIEEPPEHARFIFTAQDTGAALPTVLSRVVTVPIAPISEAAALHEVRRLCPQADEAAITLVNRFFPGNIGRMTEALNTPELLAEAADAAATVESVKRNDRYETLRLLTQKASSKLLGDFLDDLEILSERSLGAEDDEALPKRRQMKMLQAAMEAKKSLAMNANKALLMTALCVKLYE